MKTMPSQCSKEDDISQIFYRIFLNLYLYQQTTTQISNKCKALKLAYSLFERNNSIMLGMIEINDINLTIAFDGFILEVTKPT